MERSYFTQLRDKFDEDRSVMFDLHMREHIIIERALLSDILYN